MDHLENSLSSGLNRYLDSVYRSATECGALLFSLEDRVFALLQSRRPAAPSPRGLLERAFSLTPEQSRFAVRLAVSSALYLALSAALTLYLSPLSASSAPVHGDEEEGSTSSAASPGDPASASPVQLTVMERAILRSCRVEPPPADCSPSSAFAAVGGLQGVLARLQEQAVLPLQSPHLLAHSALLQAPSGVLLYGPPGTGKTLLASRLALSTRATFLAVSPATLKSMYVGQSAKLTAAAFSLARKLAPAILFFDELDGLMPRRDSLSAGQQASHEAEFIANFLGCWEGLGQQGGGAVAAAGKWVLVVGATNRIAAIDPAALRRLPVQLEVPMPDQAARASILAALLAGERCSGQLALQGLAAETQGFSGSDLKELVKAAALMPVKEAWQLGGGGGGGGGAPVVVRGITEEDLHQALTVIRPSSEIAGKSRFDK